MSEAVVTLIGDSGDVGTALPFISCSPALIFPGLDSRVDSSWNRVLCKKPSKDSSCDTRVFRKFVE